MKLSDFDYYLPKELIAQEPSSRRDHSRLLVYNKENKLIEHGKFFEIAKYLKPGDLLFLNNSKVFPARIICNKKTGAKVEVFLLKNIDKKNNTWECLLKGKISSGDNFFINEKILAQVLERQDGVAKISFDIGYDDFLLKINSLGQTPLPPYIKRDRKEEKDVLRYQTVYANNNRVGSAAAPTAGLHFTKDLIKKLKNKGVEIAEGTLHVGLGTFSPIKTENIIDHKMHREEVVILKKDIEKIVETKKRGGRVIAVGTTSCRILESLEGFLKKQDNFFSSKHLEGDRLNFYTDIFIYPGYEFKIIDGLITNFHLPKSSLLLLISALIGRDDVIKAYELAIKEGYRFFSYGDAMLII
jgi:S-adenosylmethionine:tRNA ribosyltransferase-isomerase